MLIDWFTVAAQAVNFAILVWLMKRFLYKPILTAINARETLIAAELADAAAGKAGVAKDRDAFQHKNEEFDQQRAALMATATNDAKGERERIVKDAKKAADTAAVAAKEAIRTDAARLNLAITRRTQDEVFSISRRMLSDLAGTSLEARIVDVFIIRLRATDGEAKTTLAEALRTSTEPSVIRSAFDLPSEQQSAIQTAINETFSAAVPLRFETSPDLVSGIELSVNGQKVSWNIGEYLDSLEKAVGELLKKQAAQDSSPPVKTEPKPVPKI